MVQPSHFLCDSFEEEEGSKHASVVKQQKCLPNNHICNVAMVKGRRSKMDFKGQKTWPCIKGKSGKTTKAQCGLKQHYSWTQCALLCQFSIVVTKVKLTNFRLLLRNGDENDRKLLRLFLTSMILITASGAGSCFLFFLKNKKYDQLFPFKLKLKEKKCRFLPLHGHKTLCDRRLTCQTLKRTKQMIQAKVEFHNGWKKVFILSQNSLSSYKNVVHLVNGWCSKQMKKTIPKN